MDIDLMLVAGAYMNFFCWFDGAAKDFKVELDHKTFSQLEIGINVPPGFIDELIAHGLLSYKEPLMVAKDRSWAGTGQKNRKSRRVYFIRDRGTGLVKIGVSHNPDSRMKQLRTSGDVELLGSFPGDVPEEAKLHRQFAEHRRHGEWFEASPGLLELIKSHGGRL